MTENEIVYGIRERIRELADDSDISNRQILFEVNNQRALYYSKKGRKIDDTVKQEICMNVNIVDPMKCGCTTSGCKALRTATQVPATITTNGDQAGVLMVRGNNLLSRPFSFISWEKIRFSGNNEFTSRDIYAALGPDGYLYFKSGNPEVELLASTQVIVTLLMENPKDANNFVDCSTNTSCYSADSQYPLKASLYAYIAPIVVQSLLQREQLPRDEANNANDDKTQV